jgi:hypothetical protein
MEISIVGLHQKLLMILFHIIPVESLVYVNLQSIFISMCHKI